MKQIYIVLSIICMALFAACEKEEMNIDKGSSRPGGNEDYIINPEDTAGIIVPEGYSLVIFPGSKAQTRAVTGEDGRISHLKYLIYQADETGTFKLFKEKTIFSSPGKKTWPYTAQTEILPTGKNYKVVFLGNVDNTLFGEEVLTGTETYSTARIHLPNIGFSENTMYYWFRTEDMFTPDATTPANNIIPVLLQRIVSRYNINKEKLEPSYQNISSIYLENYEAQLLDKQLKDDVFTGSQSVFGQNLQAEISNVFIKSLIYIITKKNGETIDETTYPVMKWYKDNPLSGAAKEAIDYHYQMSQHIDFDATAGSKFVEKLYNICVSNNDEDAKAVIDGFLTTIYDNNSADNATNATDKTPSVTKAINLVRKEIEPLYGPLYWQKFVNAEIDMTGSTIPTIVDFDLNVEGTETWSGVKKYTFSKQTNEDSSISIYMLGTNNSATGLSLKINSILAEQNTQEKIYLTTDLPVTGESFLANTSIDHTLTFPEVALKDYTASGSITSHNVMVNYFNFFDPLLTEENGNLIMRINGKEVFTCTAGLSMTRSSVLKYLAFLLYFSYKRYDVELWNFNECVYPVKFDCPVLNSNNIEIEKVEWR